MMVGLMDAAMADDKPKTLSVKLEMDVIESARIVAAYRGETMTEMLSGLLRPLLTKMEKEEATKRQRQIAKEFKVKD